MDEDGAKTEGSTTYKTDDKGRVTEEVSKIPEYDEYNIIVHKYNDLGFRTSTLIRNHRKGEKVGENLQTWKYTKSGKLLEATRGVGHEKETTAYSYDDKGRLSKIEHKGLKLSWATEFGYN